MTIKLYGCLCVFSFTSATEPSVKSESRLGSTRYFVGALFCREWFIIRPHIRRQWSGSPAISGAVGVHNTALKSVPALEQTSGQQKYCRTRSLQLAHSFHSSQFFLICVKINLTVPLRKAVDILKKFRNFKDKLILNQFTCFLLFLN